MPNHWHLVVRPKTDEALGRWLGWVGVTHVRRHHEHYHRRGGGHLYQGRFKSFPVESDEHFLTLCRYVEANPRRAKLVARAEDWPWSGLARRLARATAVPLSSWPLRRPADWLERVNRSLPRARPPTGWD
jgi:putative transposase